MGLSRMSSIFLLALCACTTTPPVPKEPIAIQNPATKVPAPESPQVLHTIALASCNRQNLPQPLWRKLQEEKPELFVWMGDAIYADTHDMALMSRLFQQQLQQAEYAQFLATGVPVVGVYDDHDFGMNDVGRDFPEKLVSKDLFLDFIGEPKDSPRRKRSGIYQAYHFGKDQQRIKVILLDTRYNREKPGASSDILGEEQWQWLTRELQGDDAELVLIVSSIQVLPFEHDFEKWENFPKSRARLLALLDQAKAPNLALFSGDRHLAELSRLNLPSGREIYELTTSGLTHSYSQFTDARNKNSLRVGSVLPRLNYGLVHLNWESKPATMTLEVRDINRQPIIKQTISLKGP